MGTIRKILLSVAVGLAALILLLVVAAALAPRWINLHAVRQRIADFASRAISGTLAYERLDISILPLPGVVLHHVRIAIPGIADGSAESVALRPEIVSLLRRDFRISKVRAVALDIRLLPMPPGAEPMTPENARERAARFLATLSESAPGLVFESTRGRLTLPLGENPAIVLEGIEGRVVFPPDSIRVEFMGKSSPWGRISFSGRLEPEGLKGTGKATAERLDAASIGALLPPSAGIRLAGEATDISISFGTGGFAELKADVTATFPAITFLRGERKFAAQGLRIAGTFEADRDRFRISGFGLSSSQAPLRLAGEFVLDLSKPHARLKLHGTDLDATGIRAAALSFAGDIHPVPEIFDWLRSGAIPSISFDAEGKTVGDLFRPESFVLKGTLRDGAIRVVPANLYLSSVGAELGISKGTITASRVDAGLGNSRASGATVSVSLLGPGVPFRVEVPVRADLSELPAIMKDVPLPPRTAKLLAGLEEIRGMADGLLSFSGRSGTTRWAATGTLSGVLLKSGHLPGPLSLPSGSFGLSPEAVDWKGVRMKILDAELITSGKAEDPWGGAPYFGATDLSGEAGPDAVRWLSTAAGLPSTLSFRAPVTFSGARFSHTAGKDAAFSGTFSVRGGPTVAADLVRGEKRIVVRDLSVRDEISDARGSFAVAGGELRLAFSGRLAGETLHRLFMDKDGYGGSASGKFRLALPLEHPERGTAEGELEVRELRLPMITGPFLVRSLSVTGSGSRLSVRSGEVSWENRLFSFNGILSADSSPLRIDMSLHAPELSVEEIGKVLGIEADAGKEAGSHAGDTGPPKKSKRWPLPVEGKLRLSADAITWRKLSLSRITANLWLSRNSVTVAVTDAGICGVSAAGTLSITPRQADADFTFEGANIPLDNTLACLDASKLRMTGTYSLYARLEGSGDTESLPASLHGPFRIEARKGRILRATPVMKVLSLLDVTELFRGRIPGLGGEGVAYESIRIRGEAANGKLVVREGTLDAASANFFFQGSVDPSRGTVEGVVLASPFRTIDAVIRSIPLFGYVMKDRLVAVPVSVSGPIDDPKTSFLPPSEVGAGLLGIVERTLKLPVHIISPMLPK